MSKIRALRVAFRWLKEYSAFVFHYGRVWGHPGGMSDADIADWKEQMRNSPMRFEYERIEQMKDEANRLWSGGRPSDAPRANAKAQQPAQTSEKSHNVKESEGNL